MKKVFAKLGPAVIATLLMVALNGALVSWMIVNVTRAAEGYFKEPEHARTFPTFNMEAFGKFKARLDAAR